MRKAKLFKEIHLLFLFASIMNVHTVLAQEEEDDETYYQEFPGYVTGRYYFSRKYTSLRIKDRVSGQNFHYMPNSTLNMGVGATYENLTLNLAYGFGFMNPDIGRGDTKYLDLQAHAYPKKMVIDLFGQFYNGYYLTPNGYGIQDQEPYFLQPEMKVRKFGASFQHLFNYDKFSYRAAFLQNEWQKKSAGSFLLGFEMYGGLAEEENGILPPLLLQAPEDNIRKISFFEFGPNAGYAYTLVIKEHFFITASLTSNLAVGFSNIEKWDDIHSTRWGINPNLFLRGFAGYNSDKWSVNVNYVKNNVRMIGNQNIDPSMTTGNYRLNFIYRFLPGPGVKKYLRYVDVVKERIGI